MTYQTTTLKKSFVIFLLTLLGSALGVWSVNAQILPPPPGGGVILPPPPGGGGGIIPPGGGTTPNFSTYSCAQLNTYIQDNFTSGNMTALQVAAGEYSAKNCDTGLCAWLESQELTYAARALNETDPTFRALFQMYAARASQLRMAACSSGGGGGNPCPSCQTLTSLLAEAGEWTDQDVLCWNDQNCDDTNLCTYLTNLGNQRNAQQEDYYQNHCATGGGGTGGGGTGGGGGGGTPVPCQQPATNLPDGTTFNDLPQQRGTINRVTEEMALAPVNTESQLDGLGHGSKDIAHQYFDGLGRPLQTVSERATPDGLQDIVQPMRYDPAGRQPLQYLPYATNPRNANAEGFFEKALIEQGNFYNSSPDIAYHTGRPFAETAIEASPLGRPLAQGAPGEDWALDLVPHRAVKANQRTNDLEEVKEYAVDASGQLQWNTGSPNHGFYPEKILLVQETTDEHGSLVLEFTDREGRLLLKRVEGGEQGYIGGAVNDPHIHGGNYVWMDTYYVYDDLGRLRYVLQPEYQNTPNVDLFAFQYRYDERGRLIEKRIPGQDDVHSYVYDVRDRLVLSQDPAQKARGEWSFTKYDRHDRVIMTGLLWENFRVYRLNNPGLPWREYFQNHINSNHNTPRRLYEDENTTIYAEHSYSNKYAFPTLYPSGEIDEPLVLTVNYYDDYQAGQPGTTLADILPAAHTQYAQLQTNDLNDQAHEYRPPHSTRGLLTVSKVRILDDPNDKFLYSVTHYDHRHRPVQAIVENHQGNWDISSTLYGFDGRILKTRLEHSSDDVQVGNILTESRTEYYENGLPKATFQNINGTGEEQLHLLEYDVLGKLTRKRQHLATHHDPNSALQNVDFTYNIRGWMRGINDVHLTEASDLFGMELSYQCVSGGAITAQYNGNIAALEWASRTDEERRRYTYSYDRVNRLLEADYQHIGGTPPTHVGGENYSVKELKYDLNGNLLGLKRYGLTSAVTASRKTYGIIDHLKYYYLNFGNRLFGVDDLVANQTTHAEYFNDNNGNSKVPIPGGHRAEYSYDENGNLTEDKNKNIETIEYNHLNLPTKITFAGNKEIAYTYDAAGTKLSKTATQNGTAISQTDYVNGHIYQDGQLEFFGMPEGRMYAQRDANGNFEALKPEYHLTDHLGNLRVAWRPEQASSGRSFMMTAEPENRADEDTTFQNLAEAPRAKGFESPTAVSLSQYDPAIKKEFIPLEEGQEVEVSVLGLREILQSTEEESDIPTSTGKTENGIIPVPIIVNGTNTHNSGDVAKQGSVRANLLGVIPFAKKLFSKKEKPAPAPRKPNPEGELVISFYDSTKELLSTEILSLKSENEWETLAFSAKAEEKGFVSASIRGTSSEPVKFDDFSIQLKSLYQAKLYQENHYYPFGMNMKGLESSDKQTTQNKKEHEFQFNAQTEREESFGLFWDETPFRAMDMQLGRFWGVDRLIESYASLTPFHYSLNNPISYNDPTGLFPDLPTGGGLSGFDPFMSNEDRMQNFMSSQSGRPGGFFGGGFTSGKDGATSRTIYDFQDVAHTIDESDLVKGGTIVYDFLHTAYLEGGNWVYSNTQLMNISIIFNAFNSGTGVAARYFFDNHVKKWNARVGYVTKPVFLGAKAYLAYENLIHSVNQIYYEYTAFERAAKPWKQEGLMRQVELLSDANTRAGKFIRNAKLGSKPFFLLGLGVSVVDAGLTIADGYNNGFTSEQNWKLAGIGADIAIGTAAFFATGPLALPIAVAAGAWYLGRTVYQNRNEIKSFLSK